MKILGISTQHDSGAVILDNGVCLAAMNEERLNRQKLFTGFPSKSIQSVFEISGINLNDIDAIALAGTIPVKAEDWDWFAKSSLKQFLSGVLNQRTLRSLISTSAGFYLFRQLGQVMIGRSRQSEVVEALQKKNLLNKPIVIDHHVAHLYSAIASSPWRNVVALSLDASGDGCCSKVAVYENGQFKEVHSIPFFHSPAHYYGYVTHILGFRQMYHEGKVTGLAAYGRPEKVKAIFEKRISYVSKLMRFDNHGGYLLKEISFLKNALEGFSREDISAGIQAHLEDLVTSYISDVMDKHGKTSEGLVLAGGVFANVKLNQRIANLSQVRNLSIHPHMGDGGLALGAAVAAYHELTDHTVIFAPMKTVCLGQFEDLNEIRDVLEKESLQYDYLPETINRDVGRWLAEGQVVARVVGRMEYGPRALGNRSILYHTSDPKVNQWLNDKLNRSEFMPFAPSILANEADKYVKSLEKIRFTSEFMTVTCDCYDLMKQNCPAVVHVDGTARPQLVSFESNPGYYEVLKEYFKLTGIPVILNTSFNIHDEPIVCSPQDAVRAFLMSDLDILALGPFAIHSSQNRDKILKKSSETKGSKKMAVSS